MYCDCRGRMFSFLNSSRHDTLLPAFIIILIIYNLTNIINFPLRIQNTYVTVIDNIFIDISQFESYTTTPILNGLVDQGYRLLMISRLFP
jgi:hypothetical protein